MHRRPPHPLLFLQLALPAEALPGFQPVTRRRTAVVTLAPRLVTPIDPSRYQSLTYAYITPLQPGRTASRPAPWPEHPSRYSCTSPGTWGMRPRRCSAYEGETCRGSRCGDGGRWDASTDGRLSAPGPAYESSHPTGPDLSQYAFSAYPWRLLSPTSFLSILSLALSHPCFF